MKIWVLIAFIFSSVSFISISTALETQHLISFQGYVTNKSTGFGLSSGNLRVKIYDASSGGNLKFDSSSDYNNIINNGVFDVLLGSQTALNLDNTILYYLEMSVNGETIDLDAGAGVRQMFWAGGGNHTHTHDASAIASGIMDKARLPSDTSYLGSSIGTSEIESQAINNTLVSNSANIASSKINTTGLNADTLDGNHSYNFSMNIHSHTMACTEVVGSTGVGVSDAYCSSGYKVMGGGCAITASDTVNVFYPASDLSFFRCVAKGTGSTTAYAVCCNLTIT